MAPRIRLNLAKPLPTITEAFEDILEDITITTKGFGNVYMNPESICQLARSSFPALSESKYKVQEVDKLGMLHNSNKVLNISETSKMIPMYTLPNMTSLEKKSFILDCLKTYSSTIEDPLEELRTEAQKIPQWRSHNGHENTDTECLKHHFHGTHAFSVQEKMLEKQDVACFFPRLPSSRPPQRDDNSSEQKVLKNQGRMQTPARRPNMKGNNLLRVNGKSVWLHPPTETPLGSKVVRSSQRGQMLKTAAFPEGDQLKYFTCSQNRKGAESNEEDHGRYFHIGQRATTFDWISEYQSAWKAAKVTACLLPAIAES